MARTVETPSIPTGTTVEMVLPVVGDVRKGKRNRKQGYVRCQDCGYERFVQYRQPGVDSTTERRCRQCSIDKQRAMLARWRIHK